MRGKAENTDCLFPRGPFPLHTQQGGSAAQHAAPQRNDLKTTINVSHTSVARLKKPVRTDLADAAGLARTAQSAGKVVVVG